MSLFNKLGHYFIRLFSFTGMLILSIPKIPDKLRSIDSSEIREKIDTDSIKDNLSRIREDTSIDEKVSRITRSKSVSESIRPSKELDHVDDSDTGVVMIGGGFTSEEKEKTILILQILSASFVVISILTIFNFISFLIYIPIGTVVVAYITYLLYKNGSRGILVEPNITLTKKLKKYRRKDITLNIGISDEVSEMDSIVLNTIP
jgi:uncharacterized membrane protein